jgi:uncharacterized protein
MARLVLVALVGLAAQLVDGALGMAYGVTSTTLLLFAGVAPASASASVHLAEIGTTFASGVAHWRFGNVDWRVVTRIALPGAVGSFLGATALSKISTSAAAPWTSGVLLGLGVFLLARFTRPLRPAQPRPVRTGFLAPLGLVAGFVDATGGGGWGPIATPTLLASGRMEPRKVIGSVNTAEFLVAASASAGFLVGLGTSGFLLPTVAALLAGGVIGAPLAAWLVRRVPAQVIGAAVGGLIILTNTRTLLRVFDLESSAGPWLYPALGLVWVTAVTVALRIHRRVRAKVQASSVAELEPAVLS